MTHSADAVSLHPAPQADDSIVSRHPLMLPAMMIGGASLGVLIGGLFGKQWTDPGFVWARGLCRLLSDILLNSLKMLVVPLIVCSVIHAVASVGDIRKAGRIFFMTICYFIVTMMMAVCVGMVLVNTIKPGVGASTELRNKDEKSRAEKAKGVKEAPIEKLYEVVRQMFPANIFKAAVDGVGSPGTELEFAL